MRKKMVIGNWKMHGNLDSIVTLITKIKTVLPTDLNCECVVLPPTIFIPKVAELCQESNLEVGAQNFYPEEQGAFTGEISAQMLSEYNCKYVLIGHSERRHILNESDDFVARKYHFAQKFGLIPILCVGETLEERDDGLTEEVIARQLLAITTNHPQATFNDCVIAYEPVWAIGTGKTATPQQAQEVHSFIRNFIASTNTPILYGGSVNDGNAVSLFNNQDVDGGLVGGASLDADKFSRIIMSAN